MRKLCLPLIVVVLASISFTVAAHADDWSKIYDLTGKPDFRLQAHDTNIRIETWDQNKIEARVTTRGLHIGDGGLVIVEHHQGNAVEIELRQPHRVHFSIGVETRRTELEIHMPRSVKINVQSGDGDVEAKNLEGELDFTSPSGCST